MRGVATTTTTMDDSCSLKKQQREALEQVLNFNQAVDRTSDFGAAFNSKNFWKVLVYDSRGRDIVSPLLSLQELRGLGVTLHLNLHSNRDAIPSVPAVYFCEPTRANVDRIVKDLGANLYSAYHVNFTSPVSRTLLEELARLAMATGNAHRISKVHDQFLNFVCHDDRFFSLDMQDTLYQYSSPSANEEQIEALVHSVCEGLFASLVTMKALPVIFCNAGGPSEAIARQLDEKIRHSLSSKGSAFSRPQFMSIDGSATVFGGKRPALVLLDRGVDLSAALRHTATYQALLEDTLPFSRTTVTVPSDDEAKAEAGGTQKYQLNKSHDMFWATHSDSEFHDAVEATRTLLKDVCDREDEIRRRGGSADTPKGSAAVAAATAMGSIKPEDLTKTLESLPEILAAKKSLAQHTNILKAAMSRIVARRLPEFCAMETEILRSSQASVKELQTLLESEPDDGSTPEDAVNMIQDKLRLLAISLIETQENLTPEQRDALESVMRKATTDSSQPAAEGANATDASPAETVDGVLRFLNMHSALSGKQGPGTGGGGASSQSDMLVSPLNKGFGWANSLVSNVVNTVKQSYSGSDRAVLPIVRVLDAIIGGTNAPRPIDGMRFDPKMKTQDKFSAGESPKREANGSDSAFRAAVVFVVGGGNVGEYQDIQKWATAVSGGKGKRQVIYGSTDVVRPNQMLQQLGKIGREVV